MKKKVLNTDPIDYDQPNKSSSKKNYQTRVEKRYLKPASANEKWPPWYLNIGLSESEYDITNYVVFKENR